MGLTLGIESSCDETAAAVISNHTEILSSVVFKQDEQHSKFGGVVPDLASRVHVECISQVIESALKESGIDPQELDCIAVSHQPGLVGSLLVGLTAAKMLSIAWDKPIIGVNHVEAHLHAGFMSHESADNLASADHPAAGLIISGGHTSLYACKSSTEFECCGATIDDAAGEAFDKVASLFKLGYPGGPLIDALAKHGDPHAIEFPQSFRNAKDMKFSFSGLKTAVLYEAMGQAGPRDDALLENLSEKRKADIAASFQFAVVEILIRKLMQLAKRISATSLIIGGGVACNSSLRQRVESVGKKNNLTVVIPPLSLCTDNAAMIAALGSRLFQQGIRSDLATLDAAARVSKPTLLK